MVVLFHRKGSNDRKSHNIPPPPPAHQYAESNIYFYRVHKHLLPFRGLFFLPLFSWLPCRYKWWIDTVECLFNFYHQQKEILQQKGKTRVPISSLNEETAVQTLQDSEWSDAMLEQRAIVDGKNDLATKWFGRVWGSVMQPKSDCEVLTHSAGSNGRSLPWDSSRSTSSLSTIKKGFRALSRTFVPRAGH